MQLRIIFLSCCLYKVTSGAVTKVNEWHDHLWPANLEGHTHHTPPLLTFTRSVPYARELSSPWYPTVGSQFIHHISSTHLHAAFGPLPARGYLATRFLPPLGRYQLEGI